MKIALLAATGLIGAAMLSVAVAQTAAKPAPKTATEGIAEYRKMLEDGNPAELFEAKGEDLWKTPRGPAKATLRRCDLGLGPGVVKGAWVQLPRWFADTGRVQDLESRLLTCMATLQGFNAAEIAATPFDKGEQATLAALAAWISAESRGQKTPLPQAHAEEQRFYQRGKRAFSSAAGRLIFPAPAATVKPASASACMTCPT